MILGLPNDAKAGADDIKDPRMSGRAISVMYTTAGLLNHAENW